MIQAPLRNPSVLIIGAGMTGILLGIKLREMGITDITILEKKEKPGGTWRENRYPGVACDIPAHMYTYSFEPNPNWSHRFARGNEIQEYFSRVFDKYRLSEITHFQETVTEAKYNEGKWTVRSSQGKTYFVDFIFSATGILHHPAFPNIPGLESFQGIKFHTAEWDTSVNLHGKRIGVIGTGSTACQVIPELIAIADHVTVFQRTPQWIVSVLDKKYTQLAKSVLNRFPIFAKLLHKLYTFAVEQTFSNAVIGKKLPHGLMSFLCKWNLKHSVKDPVLKAKLTPNYKVGCKRVVVNSTFYKAIQKPNADLVTDSIDKIVPEGVQTKDGKIHKLDVLIMATGFHPFSFMRPMNLIGKNGITIDSAWQKKVRAYRSLFLPGFPNFFLMLGPNTPIGNFSVIAMSEVQTKYLMKIIDDWRQKKFNEISATNEALETFNAYLKKGMKNTVWLGGCQSWYLDPDGDPAMWPYTWKQWEKEMAEPDYSDFEKL